MSRFIRSALRRKAAVCFLLDVTWFVVDGLNPARVTF